MAPECETQKIITRNSSYLTFSNCNSVCYLPICNPVKCSSVSLPERRLSEKVTSTKQTSVKTLLPLESMRGRSAFPVEAFDNPRRMTPAILGGVLSFGWAGRIFGFPCSFAAAATVPGSRSCSRPVSTATYEQCDTRLSIHLSLPHL